MAKLDQSLVLFRYMLSLFDEESLETLCDGMKTQEWEGLDESNVSKYHHYLFGKYSGRTALSSKLLGYDNNIISHTLSMQRSRGRFVWKYFQYMALLFTEIYLDKYFSDQEGLLNELNDYVSVFNRDREEEEQIEPYTKEDLNKIAFWQATGSGKTLIMHVNIMQYMHYLDKHRLGKSLNRTILLTPNEGLSMQHNEECRKSGLNADIFKKDASTLFTTRAIEIIDIHKLEETAGEKTVAVESFENNNLVLVDEGHRGSTGESWMEKRQKLCELGFSFEYSATFGQAIINHKNKMFQEYAKCILFDYSYKYFYGDGYGKEYSILNLPDAQDESNKHLYLTACLIVFYQQLKLYKDKVREYVPYVIKEPLCVFVGSSVNAVRTVNAREVSDVVDILFFLSAFISNAADAKKNIRKLVYQGKALLDSRGNDLFANKYDYLKDTFSDETRLYEAIRKELFNCSQSTAELHLDNLKGVEGEIGLRVGDNHYFGVINVGDDAKLLKLCEANGFSVFSKEFSGSLFRDIEKYDSKIKILIGSKKFTEGWNSWRVSTMGLMNVGRSEGSEIIQLFGRGVRLMGYDGCLKRSSYVADISHPKNIVLSETLNIFGVRADYMSKFKEYLEEEGVRGQDDYEPFTLKVRHNPTFKKAKLMVPLIKRGIDFKKQEPRFYLCDPPKHLAMHRIELDLYPKLQALQAQGVATAVAVAKHEGAFYKTHTAFLDWDSIYYDAIRFKNERKYFNLTIDKDMIKRLFDRNDWYVIYVPEDELQFNSTSKIREWQDLALVLVRKYIDVYYKWKRSLWEEDKMEYRDIQEEEAYLVTAGEPGNLFAEYKIQIDKSYVDIIENMRKLIAKLEKKDYADFNYGPIHIFSLDKHAYNPFIYIDTSDPAKSNVKVQPYSLNKGENQFVHDLMKYIKDNPAEFSGKEVLFMRNLGRGRGIGFFEISNYYPDFMLWVVDGAKKYLTFIDPHGLFHCKGLHDPKISLYEGIKRTEKVLGNPNIILNSAIVSVTKLKDVPWAAGKTIEDMAEHHIFFQEGDAMGYIKRLFQIIIG